ncbi:MAG: type II toxin-antitoxin system Phd/YefM family antitoxin [Spirochaetaceae bacterium]|jgi:prevent-host-death family protein|nr:type II toxin-antitoxin system Phd/YefM family antitoxin [Spirochaetaceae bacterium]
MINIPKIRPVSDLRNHYGEVMEDIHHEDKPIFLTKNGKSDSVLMSIDTLEKELWRWEVYFKLKESEIEEKRNPKRYTHEEAWAEIESHLKEITA